jgi:hypothetical protein
MADYLPPGWPTGVHPPSSEEFERTAVAWLLDVVPPDYRLHGVLRRHPIALATLARRHLAACVEGARQGYRTARTELGDVLPVSGLDAVLAAYRSEGRRLVNTARAADLVERALRGKEFTPRLGDPPGTPRPPGPQEHQPGSGNQLSRPVPPAPPSAGNGHPQPTLGKQRPQPTPPSAGNGHPQPAPPAPGSQQQPTRAAPGKQPQEQPAARKQRQKQTAGGKQRRG